MPTSDKIWVKCPFCGEKKTAMIEAESISMLIVLRDDVRANYICDKCLNDPNNSERIKEHLGIP